MWHLCTALFRTRAGDRGAIGLALLGTVAWTAVANSIRTQVGDAAAAAANASQPSPKPGTPPPASIYDHALTVGFSRAFLVAAGIGLLALLIGIATIRVRRQDLTGAVPAQQEAASQPPALEAPALQPAAPQPAAPQAAVPQPGTEQRYEDRAALAAAARPCRLC